MPNFIGLFLDALGLLDDLHTVMLVMTDGYLCHSTCLTKLVHYLSMELSMPVRDEVRKRYTPT